MRVAKLSPQCVIVVRVKSEVVVASYYYLRVCRVCVKGGRVCGECECMWGGRGGVYVGRKGRSACEEEGEECMGRESGREEF